MALLRSCGSRQPAASWPGVFPARGLRWGSRVLVCAAWLLSGVTMQAQTAVSAQEYQVKAAFLYNFAKFVEWPDAVSGQGEPLVIVVFGRDPFGPILEHTVWGRKINDRPLVVRHTTRLEELMPCHILFVGSPEKHRLAEVLRLVRNSSVLTVSEVEDFLELGGAVKFVTEENKVRFAINIEATRRAGLRISSRLLSLAKVIRN